MSEVSVSELRKYLDGIVGRHSDEFADVHGEIVDFRIDTQTYHDAIVEVELSENVSVRDSRELEQYGCDGMKFESFGDGASDLYVTIDADDGKFGFRFNFV